MFEAKELEATRRAILKDMDYGLQRICGEMVDRMVRDLRALSNNTSSVTTEMGAEKNDAMKQCRISPDTQPRGAAMWQFGIQTPEPSP